MCMRDSSKSLTISDVALAAHVSKATVSRYLNKSGYVSKESAQAIANVLSEMKYHPNTFARSLRSKKRNTIFLIVPDITNPFYANVVKFTQYHAKRHNLLVVLYNTNEDMKELLTAIGTAKEIQAAGVFLWTTKACPAVIEELQSCELTAVLTNQYEHNIFDTVHSTKTQSTYLTTKHLLSLGHQRIAYVGGPSASSTAKNRKAAYALALKEANVSFRDDYCFAMEFSEEAGYRFGQHYLSLEPKPTAVCCANDLIAFGIIRFFREHGICVPDDVSITGIDNIGWPEQGSIKLTTVDLNIEETTKTMVDLLVDRLSGKYVGLPREIIVNRKFITGNSTTSPRA